jgi:hypothetical protein
MHFPVKPGRILPMNTAEDCRKNGAGRVCPVNSQPEFGLIPEISPEKFQLKTEKVISITF